ncbi:oligosaccharide flippase family protein [Arthrobacter sp. Helios]|uniref:oligosaccharide flippase family protein n=1 Tax=Arthrobacter sp. Helios TaxID=2828862 RepID=UPI002046E86C|nr:oligosaccharide flippase family protein [Arthrobacter sp. Helios]UPO77617.1 oligosaccharide flippase family protein [Arthrobacter sp. Helios]
MTSRPDAAGLQALGSRAARGALWSGANALMMKLAGIGVMVVVVRLVTPHDFGVFAAALVVHAVVSSFGELGLSSCVARRDLDPEKVASTVALLALLSSFLLAVGMALAAEPLAAALGAPEAAGPIRVLSIAVFLGGVFTVPGALLVREFRQGRVFLASIISFVPANLILVLLAVNGDGAMAFAWSRVAGQLVSGVVMALSVDRTYWPRLRRAEVGPVLRFGLPLAGANLLGYSLLNADYAIIGAFLGPGELGIYTLAFTVASWSTSVLSSTINSVAMPAFSALRSDPAELRRFLAKTSRLVALIAFPISALTIALADELVAVLYGQPWAAAAPVLRVLALYGGLFALSLLLSNLLVGQGRAGAVFGVQAAWLLILVPAVGLSVGPYGLPGAAWVHVAVIALAVFPLYLHAVRSSVPAPGRLLARAAGAPAAAAAAAALLGLLAAGAGNSDFLRLLFGGLAGCAVYLILCAPMIRRILPAAPAGRAGELLAAYDHFEQPLRRPLRLPKEAG